VAVAESQLEEAKALYYAMAGWDEEGHPRRGKLLELDLGWLLEST